MARGIAVAIRKNVQCERPLRSLKHFSNYVLPDDSVTDAGNMCRNPDGDLTIWCFTSHETGEWNYCDVPLCSGGKKFITSSGPIKAILI